MKTESAPLLLRRITRPKDRFEVFLLNANAVVLYLKDEKILLDTGFNLDATAVP